jgi:hypothetical protein
VQDICWITIAAKRKEQEVGAGAIW